MSTCGSFRRVTTEVHLKDSYRHGGDVFHCRAYIGSSRGFAREDKRQEGRRRRQEARKRHNHFLYIDLGFNRLDILVESCVHPCQSTDVKTGVVCNGVNFACKPNSLRKDPALFIIFSCNLQPSVVVALVQSSDPKASFSFFLDDLARETTPRGCLDILLS